MRNIVMMIVLGTLMSSCGMFCKKKSNCQDGKECSTKKECCSKKDCGEKKDCGMKKEGDQAAPAAATSEQAPVAPAKKKK
jgi:hypothetical protein